MGNVCFLVAVMVFAADPMAPSLTTPTEGTGLSPLLQHPTMLIHPPIVFLSYAAWSVPCALALAALGHGRLDATWTQMARPWAMSAWTLLGVGLLLGAHWAYQELGWGGYWGWDPVENGSLLPWLTGTAFIHSMMAWRHRERAEERRPCRWQSLPSACATSPRFSRAAASSAAFTHSVSRRSDGCFSR